MSPTPGKSLCKFESQQKTTAAENNGSSENNYFFSFLSSFRTKSFFFVSPNWDPSVIQHVYPILPNLMSSSLMSQVSCSFKRIMQRFVFMMSSILCCFFYFFIIYDDKGLFKKKCQLSCSSVFCWSLLLFYSNMVHKQ